MRPGRNAAATRAAILESGRTTFTKFGYDRVGVREIAQGAGVTAMLVNRYFGSKEQLFAEVVQVACADKGILTEGVTKPDRNLKTFNQDVAGALVGKTTLGAVHSTASCSC